MQVSVLNVGMPAPIPEGFLATGSSTKREHQEVVPKQPSKISKLVDFDPYVTSTTLCPRECVYAVIELCKLMDLGIPIFSKVPLLLTWSKSFGYFQISCEICGMSTCGVGTSAEQASNVAAFRMLWHLASMLTENEAEEILATIDCTHSGSRKLPPKSSVAAMVYLREFLEHRPRTGVSRSVSPEIYEVVVEHEPITTTSSSEAQVQQTTSVNLHPKDAATTEPEAEGPEEAKPDVLELKSVPIQLQVQPQPTSSDVKPAEKVMMRRIPFRPQPKQNVPVVIATPAAKSLVIPSSEDMNVYSQLLTAALTTPKTENNQPCNGALTMTTATASSEEEGGTCASDATDFVSEIKMYCDRHRLKELYEYLPNYDASNSKEAASFTAKLTIDRSAANLPPLEALGHARNKKSAKKNAAEAMFMSLKISPA